MWEGGWAYDVDWGDEMIEVQTAYNKTSENFKTQLRNIANLAKKTNFLKLEISGYASGSYDGKKKNNSLQAKRYNAQLSRDRLLMCVSFLKNKFDLGDEHILHGEYDVINHRTVKPNFNANQSVMIRTVFK